MFDQNQSVGLREVNLPGGWHLNARRVSVPPVPCHGRESDVTRYAVARPSCHKIYGRT
jgi:hypothetical protein